MPTLLELQLALSPETLLGLTDDEGSGTPGEAVIAAASSAAIAHIAARCAGTITWPEGALPVAIRDIAITLTVERLYERRREVLPGPWADRAARARVLLAEIASGQRPIDGAIPLGPRVAATRGTEDRLHDSDALDLL